MQSTNQQRMWAIMDFRYIMTAIILKQKSLIARRLARDPRKKFLVTGAEWWRTGSHCPLTPVLLMPNECVQDGCSSDFRSREKTGLEPSEDTWTCQRFPESLNLLIDWRTWQFDSYSRTDSWKVRPKNWDAYFFIQTFRWKQQTMKAQRSEIAKPTSSTVLKQTHSS